ncbi:MAG: MATE family efflux transporter [Gammaproteobacteria bacterium]|nr:MATE family efflux transporter [Gammaproteobacteria bacterium]
MMRLTIPMVFAIISMMLLGLVDTFFISLLGTNELAAASFVMPIYMLLVNVALGIGMAISSLTSRLIGEQRLKEAARFITDSHILASMIIITIAGAFYVSIDGLFTAMGATNNVMPDIRAYMKIILLGSPIIVLTFICNSTFRAIGHIKASAIFSTLLSLLNLTLDPLFIFGLGPFPELGMPGAAVATVIAACFTWICSYYMLAFKEKLLDFRLPKLVKLFDNWRKCLSIAIPAIFANIMTPLAAAIMTAMIARHGEASVAGFGVGARIESMSLLITFALSSTLPMFIGQNMGAGRADRAYQALIMCLRFALIFQIAVYFILLVLAPFISTGFSDNADVIYVIKTYLAILPLSYSAHAVVILVMVSLNVLGRPRTALLATIIRLLLLYLPLAYLGSLFWGITGLFVGAAIGNFIAGLVAFKIIKNVCREQGLDSATYQISK